MATDRCRYTPEVRGDPARGRVSCWRPTHRGSNRCIWHTDDAKSIVELARLEPGPGERLDGAVLRGLDFRDVDWLADVVLIGADFSSANVSRADLSGTDLRKSTFQNATCMRTDFRRANLEGANVSDADLRGADLTMARLDDTNFANSRITSKTTFGERVVYEREMRTRTDRATREESLESAIRAYRKLEDLSQRNSLYSQASRYYRKSKDVRRQFDWWADDYGAAVTAEASRLFTGYGNRPWRVILTSIAVILITGLIYPVVGGLRRTTSDRTLYAIGDLSRASVGEVGTALLRGVFFSTITFTTLGYGNLEPVTTVGRYVAGMEAFLGGILTALLVAVLIRSTWFR